MSIKTYSYSKYLATLASILLFISPVLGFVQALRTMIGGGAVFKTPTALAATLWSLEIVGILCMVGYIFLRERLKQKSDYKYTKEDNKKLLISYSMYAAFMIFSFVYVAITSIDYLQVNDADALVWTFIPFAILLLAATVLGAIFESMSRVQEQIFLYQENEESIKDGTKSEIGVKRTKQAQELLKKDNKKSGKKATIEDDDLQDYFDNKKDED